MRKKVGIFLLFIILLTSSIFIFQMKQIKATGKTNGDWWNKDWNYRKLITINSSQVESTISNFPFLFDNTSSDFTKAQSNGDDFIFVSYDNITKYNHEIERFNLLGDNRLIAWVNITSLSDTEDTKLWLYYGNPDCSNQQNTPGVWDSDYIAVYHFKESDFNYEDSTSNNNDITSGVAPTREEGILGYRQHFDGSSNYLVVPIEFPQGNYTFECFATLDSVSARTGILFAQNSTNNPTTDYPLAIGTSSADRIYCGHSAQQGGLEVIGNYCQGGVNQQWVGIYTIPSNQPNFYLNGSEQTLTALGFFNNNNGYRTVGARYSGGYSGFWDGTVDEVKISKIDRNVSWIKTTDNSIRNTTTFISIGSEEMRSEIIVSDPYPVEGAINVELTPIMSIIVNHISNNQMNITWKWNNSGSWDVFGTNYNVFNGTYNQVNMNFSSYNTTYEWRVEVDDRNGNWMNKTYGFTTIKETGPPIVKITQPQQRYLYINIFGTQYKMSIFPAHATIIIGKLDIVVNATDDDGINWVKFYINDELRATKNEPPYNWTWNEPTIIFPFRIKIIASDLLGNEQSANINVWKVQLFEVYGLRTVLKYYC